MIGALVYVGKGAYSPDYIQMLLEARTAPFLLQHFRQLDYI